jgi:hypothetical protein
MVAAGCGFGLVGLMTAVPASAATPSINVVSTSTTMSPQATHTSFISTATCPAGETLVGGGDELTTSGALVSNNGTVTSGMGPSTPSGNLVPTNTTDPESWATTASYAGQAGGGSPSIDTSYAMCSSGVTSATETVVASTAVNSLGPITAVCPAGTSLVGGGGGYTVADNDNTKIFDSFPSDATGDVPTNGSLQPTAWTVQGTGAGVDLPTTAMALCATDVAVTTEVATASSSSTGSASSSLSSTATCPAGSLLLDGGSHITAVGGSVQGVHLIGDYPSDTSGNGVASGSAGSWTVVSQVGGGSLTSLATETLALCATSIPTTALPEATYPAAFGVIAAIGAGAFFLYRRRTTRTI